MKGLREKFRNKKGFTLVEMLIVVAIIAILIAISIPLVNNALEKARDATDDANFRSAAALGTIKYLTEDDAAAGTYFYFTNKASQGSLHTTTSAATTADSGNEAYKSKCTDAVADGATATHGATGTSKDKYIKVTIGTDGGVTVAWDKTAPST